MFVSALVAISILASSAVAQSACARNYTVASGDTCDGISAAHQVSTYQLATINPAINDACTNLEPGQDLCLGYTGSDCTATYVVQSGDSCDAIASTYSINGTFLGLNNPQIDSSCDNIYVGEVLCVADVVYSLPTFGAESASMSSTAASVSITAVTTLTPAGAVAPTPTPIASSSFSSSTPTPTSTDDDDCDDDDDDA